MENYSYPTSYPDSSHSSPRSREIEYDNPSPWDDQSSQLPPNYKVKFMCSYNGKITPRPHDNALTYVGGETKILAVDRNIKFPALIGKLSGLVESDVVFKYQLPGEDLDALISVTNDDDLEHMMHEYDRLNRAAAKPARMRLFLFRVDLIEPDRFGSGDSKFSEKDRFVEALNSAPQVQDSISNSSNVNNSNVDFLFGLERGGAVPVPVRVPEPEVLNRVVSDPVQRFGQEQHEPVPAMYKQRSDDVNYRVAGGGEYYAPAAAPEKQLPPMNMPVQVQSYWQENQMPVGAGGYTVATNPLPDQPVYMMHAPHPGTTYHPQMRQGGYYAVPRVAPEAYREQAPPQPQHPVTAMYSMVPPPKMAVPTPGSGYPPSSEAPTGYAQVGYDSSGRQVYYTTAPGGGVNIVQAPPQQQQQQQVSTTTSYGQQGQESKMVVTKVTQAPV